MAGRPTKRTPEIIQKIEEVAALDGSVEEMAFYAGVHRETLYNWMRDDVELYDRIQELRQRPILKARQTIAASLNQPEQAKWYLERKSKKEFSTRIEQDITTGGDKIDAATAESVKELSDRFDEWYKQHTG